MKNLLSKQIATFADTYDDLIDCFGGKLPIEALSGSSGLPIDIVTAVVLCKDIERSIEELNKFLIKYPNISALGFSGSGHAHLINIADDDAFFIAYENISALKSGK